MVKEKFDIPAKVNLKTKKGLQLNAVLLKYDVMKAYLATLIAKLSTSHVVEKLETEVYLKAIVTFLLTYSFKLTLPELTKPEKLLRSVSKPALTFVHVVVPGVPV